jgi:hypothetical protein
MPKKLQSSWPEAFVSDASIAVSVSRAVAKGHLRKLAPRLYTSNLADAPEAIIRRNLWPIVGGLVPDGLIADRTALENAPPVMAPYFWCLPTDSATLPCQGLR